MPDHIPYTSPASRAGPIYYFCTRRHADTIAIFLDYYDNRVKGHLRIVPYEMLPTIGQFPPGTFVFTDLDRLTPTQKASAIALDAAISSQNPSLLRLNEPGRMPGRFDLLKRLKAAGLNRFDVHRLGDRQDIHRFPVFLRWESQHVRPLSGLLESAGALEDAVEKLSGRVRSDPDLMIVEFGAAPFADGRFRKYSAFQVGETIYPQHCFISPGWYIKFAGTRFTDADIAEHQAYLRDNPHEASLRQVFDAAGIDYGRIDYGLVDGRVQTFEINSNPTVLARPQLWDLSTDYSIYAAMHDDALQALLRPPLGPPIRFGSGSRTVDDIHNRVLRQLRRRLALRRTKQRLLGAFRR